MSALCLQLRFGRLTAIANVARSHSSRGLYPIDRLEALIEFVGSANRSSDMLPFESGSEILCEDVGRLARCVGPLHEHFAPRESLVDETKINLVSSADVPHGGVAPRLNDTNAGLIVFAHHERNRSLKENLPNA